jgi:hypothetical protein
MNEREPTEEWKQEETVIAVEGDQPGEWVYNTYPDWDEAIAAVEAARRQGKAAVIYSGASPQCFHKKTKKLQKHSVLSLSVTPSK